MRSSSTSTLSRQSSRDSFSLRGNLDSARNFGSCVALLPGSEPTAHAAGLVPGMPSNVAGGWSNCHSNGDRPPPPPNASSAASLDEARAKDERDKEPQFSAVRVVLRFRPPVASEDQQEELQPARPGFLVDPTANVVESPDLQHRFQFDRALTDETTQEMVYDDVGRPVVDDVLQGYHGTILAYGQTGSGKTYCMFGPAGQNGFELQGLVPRAAAQIFDHIGDGLVEGIASTVECSFFEVYCEQMRDLLKPGNSRLQVKENTQKGFFVEGLTHKPVNSVNEVLQVLRAGLRQRAAANTRLNHHSSRSHAIFTLRVQQRTPEGLTRNGKLTLVDLAGSEKVNKSGSDGEMLEEAKKINSSLSVLGHVIDALAERRPHVPYRDSKLTRILEDSLGGNCRTTLLVACSPSSAHFSETLSSLRFAARAKKVCNYARVNVTQGAADRQLLNKIAQLRRELAKAHHELERRFARDSPSPPPAPSLNPMTATIKPRALARSWTKETLETEVPSSEPSGHGQAPLVNSASASSITSSLPYRAPSVVDGPPPIVTMSGASREDTQRWSIDSRDAPILSSREDCATDVPSSARTEGSAGPSVDRVRQVGSVSAEPSRLTVPPVVNPLMCQNQSTNDDLTGRKFSWLIEATPLGDHAMRQHRSTGMLPRPCHVLGGPSVDAEEEDDAEDITNDVRELQLRLELERTRCATLSMELEQRTQESKTLWRQLSEAEARTSTTQLSNGASMPALPLLVQDSAERVYTPRSGNMRQPRQDSNPRSVSAQRRFVAVASRTTTPSPLRTMQPCTIKTRSVSHVPAWVSPRRSSPSAHFRRTGSQPLTRQISVTPVARGATPMKRSVSPNIRLATPSSAQTTPGTSHVVTTPRVMSTDGTDASSVVGSGSAAVISAPGLSVSVPLVVTGVPVGTAAHGASVSASSVAIAAVPIIPPAPSGDVRSHDVQRWISSAI